MHSDVEALICINCRTCIAHIQYVNSHINSFPPDMLSLLSTKRLFLLTRNEDSIESKLSQSRYIPYRTMQKKLLLSAICRGVYVYACMHVHLYIYTYALVFYMCCKCTGYSTIKENYFNINRIALITFQFYLLLIYRIMI